MVLITAQYLYSQPWMDDHRRASGAGIGVHPRYTYAVRTSLHTLAPTAHPNGTRCQIWHRETRQDIGIFVMIPRWGGKVPWLFPRLNRLSCSLHISGDFVGAPG